jgi:hypothetical protein
MAIFKNATQGEVRDREVKENQAHGLFVGCGSTLPLQLASYNRQASICCTCTKMDSVMQSCALPIKVPIIDNR